MSQELVKISEKEGLRASVPSREWMKNRVENRLRILESLKDALYDLISKVKKF